MSEQVPRLSSQDFLERKEKLASLMSSMSVNESRNGELGNDKEINTLWRKALPLNNFGELSLRQANEDFVTGFTSALEEGKVADYINGKIAKGGYNDFYIALGAGETKSEKAIFTNHSLEMKPNYETRLSEFEEQLNEGGLLSPVINEYKCRIIAYREFIERMALIGSKQLTPGQSTQVEWGRLIDFEKSHLEKVVILKYENLARGLLEELRDTEPVFENFEKAFIHMKATQAERDYVLGDEILEKKLLPSQGERWINVLMRRMGLSDEWKIEEVSGGKPLSVNARAKRLKFPIDRLLSPDDVAYNAPHDVSHCVRGTNGGNQDNVVASEGTDGYLATEEGLSVLIETILGQPFIHERKQIFAARYLAVSMAMKTKEVDGEVVAKHSIQEIYDCLKDYGVNYEKAGQIIWRLFRGTSLKQEIVTINAEENGEEREFMIPECFAKDAVYFEGMMKVYEWASDLLPYSEGDRTSITSEAREYSNRLISRLGRAVMPVETYTKNNDETLKEWYRRVVFAGREILLSMANYLGVGKLSLEAIASEEWKSVLDWQKTLDYRHLLRPLREDQVESMKNQEWLIPLK